MASDHPNQPASQEGKGEPWIDEQEGTGSEASAPYPQQNGRLKSQAYTAMVDMASLQPSNNLTAETEGSSQRSNDLQHQQQRQHVNHGSHRDTFSSHAPALPSAKISKLASAVGGGGLSRPSDVQGNKGRTKPGSPNYGLLDRPSNTDSSLSDTSPRQAAPFDAIDAPLLPQLTASSSTSFASRESVTQPRATVSETHQASRQSSGQNTAFSSLSDVCNATTAAHIGKSHSATHPSLQQQQPAYQAAVPSSASHDEKISPSIGAEQQEHRLQSGHTDRPTNVFGGLLDAAQHATATSGTAVISSSPLAWLQQAPFRRQRPHLNSDATTDSDSDDSSVADLDESPPGSFDPTYPQSSQPLYCARHRPEEARAFTSMNSLLSAMDELGNMMSSSRSSEEAVNTDARQHQREVGAKNQSGGQAMARPNQPVPSDPRQSQQRSRAAARASTSTKRHNNLSPISEESSSRNTILGNTFSTARPPTSSTSPSPSSSYSPYNHATAMPNSPNTNLRLTEGMLTSAALSTRQSSSAALSAVASGTGEPPTTQNAGARSSIRPTPDADTRAPVASSISQADTSSSSSTNKLLPRDVPRPGVWKVQLQFWQLVINLRHGQGGQIQGIGEDNIASRHIVSGKFGRGSGDFNSTQTTVVHLVLRAPHSNAGSISIHGTVVDGILIQGTLHSAWFEGPVTVTWQAQPHSLGNGPLLPCFGGTYLPASELTMDQLAWILRIRNMDKIGEAVLQLDARIQASGQPRPTLLTLTRLPPSDLSSLLRLDDDATTALIIALQVLLQRIQSVDIWLKSKNDPYALSRYNVPMWDPLFCFVVGLRHMLKANTNSCKTLYMQRRPQASTSAELRRSLDNLAQLSWEDVKPLMEDPTNSAGLPVSAEEGQPLRVVDVARLGEMALKQLGVSEAVHALLDYHPEFVSYICAPEMSWRVIPATALLEACSADRVADMYVLLCHSRDPKLFDPKVHEALFQAIRSRPAYELLRSHLQNRSSATLHMPSNFASMLGAAAPHSPLAAVKHTSSAGTSSHAAPVPSSSATAFLRPSNMVAPPSSSYGALGGQHTHAPGQAPFVGAFHTAGASQAMESGYPHAPVSQFSIPSTSRMSSMPYHLTRTVYESSDDSKRSFKYHSTTGSSSQHTSSLATALTEDSGTESDNDEELSEQTPLVGSDELEELPDRSSRTFAPWVKRLSASLFFITILLWAFELAQSMNMNLTNAQRGQVSSYVATVPILVSNVMLGFFAVQSCQGRRSSSMDFGLYLMTGLVLVLMLFLLLYAGFSLYHDIHDQLCDWDIAHTFAFGFRSILLIWLTFRCMFAILTRQAAVSRAKRRVRRMVTRRIRAMQPPRLGSLLDVAGDHNALHRHQAMLRRQLTANIAVPEPAPPRWVGGLICTVLIMYIVATELDFSLFLLSQLHIDLGPSVFCLYGLDMLMVLVYLFGAAVWDRSLCKFGSCCSLEDGEDDDIGEEEDASRLSFTDGNTTGRDDDVISPSPGRIN